MPPVLEFGTGAPIILDPPTVPVLFAPSPPLPILVEPAPAPVPPGQPAPAVIGAPAAPPVVLFPITGPQGPAGAQGATGPQGPSGGGSGGGAPSPFIFTQTNPSTMWHIVHGEGSNPSVVLERTDGVTVVPGSIYPDTNTVDLYFGVPTSGTATLNF